jgi:hypothetical protein
MVIYTKMSEPLANSADGMNGAGNELDVNKLDGGNELGVNKLDGGNDIIPSGGNGIETVGGVDTIAGGDDALPVTNGGTLGAIFTPQVLTPLVLTVASIAAAKRLRRMTSGKHSRKMRGGSALGTVAVPATLVVANHVLPSLLGNKSRKHSVTRRRGDRRRSTRRNSH